MTGVFSTDYSDASGMLLLDVKNKCWSKEMLDICDVREEWLPGLYESSEKTGTLKADVACELGFPKDCIVAAGAGDNAAAAIGTGTVGAGKCNLSLEQAAHFSLQVMSSEWIRTMRFIRLTMLTAAII